MDFINRSQNIFLVVFMMFILGGCVTKKQILSLEKGMTQEDVRSVLGNPGNRQFIDNIEAWQYCSITPNPTLLLSLGTMAQASYKVVFFKDSMVESIISYSNKTYCEYESIKPESVVQYSQTKEQQAKNNNQPSSKLQQQDTQEKIRQERARQQILNHGAGGCTPNFSTGGCL